MTSLPSILQRTTSARTIRHPNNNISSSSSRRNINAVNRFILLVVIILVGSCFLWWLDWVSTTTIFLTPTLSFSTTTTIMDSLGSEDNDIFLQTVESLYSKYGAEIASYRPIMRKWCQASKSCKFCDLEVEMLYMLIRETKPNHVFEMAPNQGYSSHWILHALVQNDDKSRLHSIDLHDSSVKRMNPAFRSRWTFTHGDYKDLLAKKRLDLTDYDFLFIDALHTEEFSRAYCHDILYPHHQNKDNGNAVAGGGDGVIVAIHDIVANADGGGRESAEVYKFMAYAANRIRNVFTMAPDVMPNLYHPIHSSSSTTKTPNAAVERLNRIRSQYGVIPDCVSQNQCHNRLFGPLYFENGSSPTIFFQLLGRNHHHSQR